MQEVVYHLNYKLENSYFWFLARNKIVLDTMLKKTNLGKDDAVLDVGCGTGGFASMLNKHHKVIGLDTSPLALEYAKKRGIEELHKCLLHEFDPSGKNIKAMTFLDVIEHIEDDKGVVKTAYEMLPQGGWIIATVPAYQWMWSHHDVVHMHYRRYTLQNFTGLIEHAGFTKVYGTYFNTFLFPAVILKRTINKIFSIKNEQPIEEVHPVLNSIFEKIFKAEDAFIPVLSFPFGLSILLIAQKK